MIKVSLGLDRNIAMQSAVSFKDYYAGKFLTIAERRNLPKIDRDRVFLEIFALDCIGAYRAFEIPPRDVPSLDKEVDRNIYQAVRATLAALKGRGVTPVNLVEYAERRLAMIDINPDEAPPKMSAIFSD